MSDDALAMYLTRGSEARCRAGHIPMKPFPPTHHVGDRFFGRRSKAARVARRGERFNAELEEVLDRLDGPAVDHARRSPTRVIFAPRAFRRSSIRSYPRSIWPTLLMVLVPRAQRAARSIAIPARMSGDSTVEPRNADGPATSARCGSQSTILAPMPMSLSTKNMRDSNIFSCMRMSPLHWVAVTIAIDMTSAGSAGPGAA